VHPGDAKPCGVFGGIKFAGPGHVYGLGVLRQVGGTFVADVFHPVGGLAVKLLLNGDMGHRRGWRRPMPVLLTRRKPDHITGADFLDRTAPTLHPAATGRHDQGLTERVCMPCRTGTGFEGDTGTESTRRSGRVEQRVDTHRAGKILRRSLA
jgi:hypothetical protein